MPAPDERTALRLVARGFVAMLVVLVAIPSYLTLAPAWRPAAARLACAALVAFGCVKLLRSVRGELAGHSPSVLDAPPPRRGPAELDERFLRLRDELRFSTRSRTYFETILWPQLRGLDGRRGLEAPPARRRLGRDGPSMGALARLVERLEVGP
jgi:hypothetical protein